MSEVTRILDRVQQGQAEAADELLPLVYDELRRLAACKMANEAPGHTLQPTALVHEAWLRLIGSGPDQWNGRSHFFWRGHRSDAAHPGRDGAAEIPRPPRERARAGVRRGGGNRRGTAA